MGINFPTAPAIGTIHPTPAVAGVPQYTWDGEKWISGTGGGAIYISDTAPSAPVGSLWWESDTGILYVRYYDGSSTQWVAISGGVPDVNKSYVDAGDAARVRFDAAQTLTSAQHLQARNNIFAMGNKASPLAGGTDLNTLLSPGFFDGSGFLNAPDNLASWLFVEVSINSNFSLGTNEYVVQKAHTLDDAVNPRSYIRWRVNAVWVAWRLLLTGGAVSNLNVVINGGFRVNQTGYVSAAVLAAGAYGHDQWKAGTSGGDYSFTQLKSNTQITIAAGKSLVQPIEDVNVVGGSYVLSWTGTAQGRVGVNTLTPTGGYLSSPLLITGQTAGTAMSIEFNAGTLGTVKLESGVNTTPFIMQPYDEVLLACQRYFYRRDYPALMWFSTLQAYSATAASGPLFDFPVRMRSLPVINPVGTLVLTNPTGAAFTVSGGTYVTTTDAVSASGFSATGISLTPGDAVLLGASAGCSFHLSARL